MCACVCFDLSDLSFRPFRQFRLLLADVAFEVILCWKGRSLGPRYYGTGSAATEEPQRLKCAPAWSPDPVKLAVSCLYDRDTVIKKYHNI